MDECVDFYTSKINNKEKVMQNTYKLNELLRRHSVHKKMMNQFIGMFLLALKNGLVFSTPTLTAARTRARTKDVLENLLNSIINKTEKPTLLNHNILDNRYFRQFNIVALWDILPFINDKSNSEQDLLNLFFVTFNKSGKTRLEFYGNLYGILVLRRYNTR